VSLPARLCTRWAGFGVCGVEVLIRKYYENNEFLFSVYVILQISNSTLICVKTTSWNLFAFPPLSTFFQNMVPQFLQLIRYFEGWRDLVVETC